MRLNILPESLLRLQEQVRPRGIDYTTSLLEKVQPLRTKIIPQSVEMMIAQNEALKNNYVPLASLIGQSMFGIKDRTAFAIASKLQTTIDDLSAQEYEVDDYEEADQETLIEVVDFIPKLITDIYRDNSLLNNLDPRKFEEVVAELMAKEGFNVEITKQTRDGGRDIIAIKSEGIYDLRFLVECKKKSKTIGVNLIREFGYVILKEKVNKGIFVTTSYFSQDSKSEKDFMGHLLELKDQDDLIHWINKYALKKYS